MSHDTHRSNRSYGMPGDDDLEAMSQRIAKCAFEDVVDPAHRAIIMGLAIKADQAGDVADIALWFRKSKLWEGQ